MKVSECMPPIQSRQKGKGRPAATYRAARREIAKEIYREAKRAKFGLAPGRRVVGST